MNSIKNHTNTGIWGAETEPNKYISRYTQLARIAHDQKILRVVLAVLCLLAITFATLAVLYFTGQLPFSSQYITQITGYAYIGLSALATAFFIYTAHHLITSKKTIDRFHFLRGTHQIDHSLQEWHLNAALLRDYYQQTDDPELKNKIRFLANNYLGKAAPLPQHHTLISWLLEDYNDVTQTNKQAKAGYYHRWGFEEQPARLIDLNKKYALGEESPLILTDTEKCASLFPLSFHVMPESALEVEGKLLTILQDHFSRYPDQPLKGLKNSLEMSILFDSTDYFKDCIRTDNQKDKQKFFDQKYKAYKKGIEGSINRVIDRLNPHYSQSQKNKIRNFIKQNIISICRVKIDEFAGIKVLPLFANLKNKNLEKNHFNFTNFIARTGLFIGAINFRKHIVDDFESQKGIEYIPKGPNVIYFEKPADLLTRNTFTSLEKDLTDLDPKTFNHIKILGQAPLNLLHGLLNNISEADWQQLQSQPEKMAIVQTALFKIQNHLAMIHLQFNDYTKFTQSIELINCELATLFTMLSPFKEGDFSEIYKETLLQADDFPHDLADYIHCGLGKTAMNVFAGVNAAVAETNPSPVKVYSKGFYFEEIDLLGETSTFENAMSKPDQKIDLYAGIFNPNVSIDTNHTIYTERNISADIHEILKRNSGKPFTVVIDSTIDCINSPKVAALLAEFKQQITDGLLNFVILRSGQKLDMLGNDNYYGAPFYFVNNGAAHWRPFNRLLTEEVYKTDTLSNQWFCHAYKYAPEQINAYAKQIFDNTKAILAQVPEKLRPHNTAKQTIRVNNCDDKVDPSFIDIKVTGTMHKLRAMYYMAKFYKMLFDANFKVYTRASFGFFHTNINLIMANAIDESSTLRINPSLDPNVNQAFVKFFKTLI